ncbi:MAG: hypothetical protein FD123_120 [Bacteroidetes bacterium]|nr:MAG: hypothetical protein FD123_120 [Bacteroidota bacterium]
MSNAIKLFYWNYDADEGVSSDDHYEAPLEETIECMENLPDSDGNFLGLELPDGEIIQFMHDDNRGLYLDIPVVNEGGSYAKVIDISACLDIIRDMYTGKKPRDIEGLVFESY